MFYYFGYGSNINMISLRAKGVEPVHSWKANLPGWRLVFNVQHWFRHEGGKGNIVPAIQPDDHVEGVVHLCRDEDLASLDQMESYGAAYDRIEVGVETASGPIKAWAYVGLPDFLNDSCLPTRRYLNIICNGAQAAGLSEPYIEKLRLHPLMPEIQYPQFTAPEGDFPSFNSVNLADKPHLTALFGYVFDMSQARTKLNVISTLFGGKDMTLFFLKRHDTSTGNETLEDVNGGRISEPGKRYLNAYLNEYKNEFKYAGRYISDSI